MPAQWGSITDTSVGAPAATEYTPVQKLIVTSEIVLVGKVARVHEGGRFVVLNFPIGHLPAMDQRLDLYRGGLKIGEVRVAGPQRDDDVVADIVSGDAQVGDEVRSE